MKNRLDKGENCGRKIRRIEVIVGVGDVKRKG